MEETRRDLIKKAAVGSAVVWAAPAVVAVGRAQAASSPVVPPCVCKASSFALKGTIKAANLATVTIGPFGTVATAGVNAGVIALDAKVLEATNGFCGAKASVAELTLATGGILDLNTKILTSEVTAPCDCSGKRTATIAGLVASSTATVLLSAAVPGLSAAISAAGLATATVTSSPAANTVLLNFTIAATGLAPASFVKIVANEQVCETVDGVPVAVVRALHITAKLLPVAGVYTVDVDIIVAESKAGNDKCTCIP